MAEAEDISAEEKKLSAMQGGTEKMAMQIAAEATAAMMGLGWRFDAHFTETTMPDGTKRAQPALIIRALTLGEWQEVAKEKVRKQFLI
jgi:hypothetical protein